MHALVPRRPFIALLFLLGACGRPDDAAGTAPAGPTAATLGAQTVQTAAEYLAEPRYAAANTALGRRLLTLCMACHTVLRDAPHTLGPNLHGVFGRRAGSAAGYDFSAALADADFVWTPRALDAWLAEPQHFLPGNRMVFAGVPQAEDRDALIAVLLAVTADDG